MICITFMAAIFFVDRVNVSIARGAIALSYGLSDLQLGKIFSAFYLGYGVFQILSGWLANKLGPRRDCWRFGALWWAAFTALTAGVPQRNRPGFRDHLVGAVLDMGMGESVVFPSSNRWVAELDSHF